MTAPPPTVLRTPHPIHDRFHWLEPAVDEMVRRGVEPVGSLRRPLVRRLGRAAARAALDRNLTRRRGDAVIGVMANGSSARCFPLLYTHEIVPFAMDCWEPVWDVWEGSLRRMRVRTACFTARQSADEMARRIPGLRTIWTPEGIEHAKYPAGRPLAERSIDVLQIGRLHRHTHDAIAGPLADTGRNYVHPTGDAWLFADTSEMIAALADSKIFVCYPRCDTHPERAGRVETLTLRYLEGMACRNVIIGRSPRELVDLFGYDPVVPLQSGASAWDTIRPILDHPERHQSLVDRNRDTVLRLGGWDRRVARMLDDLRELGYTTCDQTPDDRERH